MAGLGILIYSLLAGAAAIGRGIENEKVKNQTYKIDEKGRPTYMDRYGKHYINGERIIPEYDYQQNYTRYVGQRTGTVYIDPKQEYRSRVDKENEEKKQKSIEEGKLSYAKYDPDWNTEITIEISTGRPIAELLGKEDGTYWMYYAREEKPSYKGKIYLPLDHKIDEPIQITQEEYDKLNIWTGRLNSHLASDYNRDYYDWKKGRMSWRSKPLVAKEDLPKVPGKE